MDAVRHDSSRAELGAGWALVHVITRLDLGGAQLATLTAMRRSAFARGRRLLLHGPGGLLDDDPRAAAVPRRVIPSLRREAAPFADAHAVRDLVAALRAHRAAHPGCRLLVHTHSSKAGVVGRLAARAAGAERVVHTAHGFGHEHHGSAAARVVFTQAERLAGRLTDAFTADSAANLHQGRRDGLFGDAPARVVRCGIDLPAFAARPGRRGAALRQQLGLDAQAPVVLGLFVLKPQKDPLTFIAVAARVRRRHPEVVFLVAGDGELRAPVEQAIHRQGLDDTVRLLGWRHDVPDLLAAADLVLHTARWEGLPQVFPQAMAAGVPIVATAVDGAAEAVVHGETGFLCSPGDVDGLARACDALLRDDDLRAAMGDKGPAAALPFSDEAMVAALDRLYCELTD